MSQRLAVIPKPSPEQSPEDVLREALGRAAEMDKVLILYEGKDSSKAGSLDNGLTLAQCLYLVESFKHWMLKSALGD